MPEAQGEVAPTVSMACGFIEMTQPSANLTLAVPSRETTRSPAVRTVEVVAGAKRPFWLATTEPVTLLIWAAAVAAGGDRPQPRRRRLA